MAIWEEKPRSQVFKVNFIELLKMMMGLQGNLYEAYYIIYDMCHKGSHLGYTATFRVNCVSCTQARPCQDIRKPKLPDHSLSLQSLVTHQSCFRIYRELTFGIRLGHVAYNKLPNSTMLSISNYSSIMENTKHHHIGQLIILVSDVLKNGRGRIHYV